MPTYTSAAVPMHDNLICTAAVSRLNPALSIRAQRGASLPMAASWTEILYDLEEAESANAEEAEMAAAQEFGDDFPDFDVAGDDNVEPGGDEIKAIWTGAEIIEKARFIPDMESKITLLDNIESMTDEKSLYEWLKKVICFCEFIVPYIEFYYVKMGTITMIVRMLDPEQIRGNNVEETVSLRQRFTQASIRFGNTAGELLCLWDTTGIDHKEWVPPEWGGDETPLSFVPFRDPPWMPETPDDLGEVSYDDEGHVLCDDHTPYQNAQDCPWCQYRKRSLIKQAKTMSPDYVDPDTFSTLVYESLPAPTLSLWRTNIGELR